MVENKSISSHLTSLKPEKFLPLFFGILYLLLPTNNPTADAWEYASNVKYGVELIRPHHLLYNPFFFELYRLWSAVIGPGTDVLHFMMVVNALFGMLSLHVLYRILKKLGVSPQSAAVWLLFAGGSFAMLRFSTENETYILPLYCSLQGSYFYLRYLQKKGHFRFILLAGIFATIGMLFHQIHFFWWLGLAIGLLRYRHVKGLLVYLIPGWIAPIVYLFGAISYYHHFPDFGEMSHFIFHSYSTGSATVDVGMKNFLLTPINFIRSFLQIHGNIPLIMRSYPVRSGFALLVVALLLWQAIGHRPKVFKKGSLRHEIAGTHLLIAGMQLAFAFFSHGNAEFMVMLPALVVIIVAARYQIPSKLILWGSLAMLVWNLSFGILPRHQLDYYDNGTLVEVIDSLKPAPLVLYDKFTVGARYRYQFGPANTPSLYAPEDSLPKGPFYTDLRTKPTPLSRRSLLHRSDTGKYRLLQQVKTIHGFYGSYTIDQVQLNFGE